jgi:hypothetical protein
MNLRSLLGAGILATALAGGSLAVSNAQVYPLTPLRPAMSRLYTPNPYNPNNPCPNRLRGERGSARNLLEVRRHLEIAIDQAQRDQRDYGGHRVQAINDMQQARQQIEEAIQWDATHRC